MGYALLLIAVMVVFTLSLCKMAARENADLQKKTKCKN